MNQTALHQEVTNPLWLVPAYGRSYRNRQQALQAWQSGKDFQILDGPYCSIRDLDLMRSKFNRIYIQYDTGSIEV